MSRQPKPGRAREFFYGTFVFSLAYTLSFVPIPAMDFFWQLATGRFVLQHGVPHTDPFSHTMFGKPWTAHEWLFCVLSALCFDKLGPEATLKVKGLICALSMLIVYLACRERGAPQWTAALFSLLCVLICRPYFDLRPQVLTYFMLSLLTFLSWRAIERSPIWLPFLFFPLQSLWANIHGTFILGPVLGLIFSAGLCLTRRLKEGGLFSGLFLALVVASFLNPYGPRHLLYPLGYAGFKTIYTEAVVEWQPPDFRNPYFWPFEAAILFLIILGPFAARRGANLLLDLVVLLPFLHLSLGVRKHVPIFAIAVVPVLARWLSAALERETHPSGPQAREASPLVYGIASALLLFPLPFVPFRERAFDRYAVLSHFPVQAANFLEGSHLPSRLFNPYDWGGYLIFRLWPKYRVFIDGRTDLYGRFVVEEYREAIGPRWREVLDSLRVNTAIVQPESEMFNRLEEAKNWRLLYRDPRAAVFVKSLGRKSSSQTSTTKVE